MFLPEGRSQLENKTGNKISTCGLLNWMFYILWKKVKNNLKKSIILHSTKDYFIP